MTGYKKIIREELRKSFHSYEMVFTVNCWLPS
jgi:hypothetical protein